MRPAPYFKRPLEDLNKGEGGKGESQGVKKSKFISHIGNGIPTQTPSNTEEEKSFHQFTQNRKKLESVSEQAKYLKSSESKFVKKKLPGHHKNPSRVFGYNKGQFHIKYFLILNFKFKVPLFLPILTTLQLFPLLLLKGEFIILHGRIHIRRRGK